MEHQGQVSTEKSKPPQDDADGSKQRLVSSRPLRLWDRCFDVKAALYALSITMFTSYGSMSKRERNDNAQCECQSFVYFKEATTQCADKK